MFHKQQIVIELTKSWAFDCIDLNRISQGSEGWYEQSITPMVS